MPAMTRQIRSSDRALRRRGGALPVAETALPPIETARQVLRYPGGKAGVKELIVRHFVPHTTYVEPFAGGASVLLHKPASPVEYLNDLDGAVSDFFAILRAGGDELDALIEAVERTPYARVELARARRTLRQGDRVGKPAGRVEYNRCLLVISWMSRMAFSHARASGWLSSKTQPRELDRWNQLPERLAQAAQRLKGVFIENRPALHLLRHLDGPETFFYLDPPYPSAAADRKPTGGNAYYRFDMSIEQHEELLDVVVGLEGKCLLSGVRSRLYDHRLKGWHRVDIGEVVAAGRRRTECLWMNYAPPAQLTLWPGTDPEQEPA